MSFEFPVGESATEYGPLSDPTIRLPAKTPEGYILLHFIVDSGASFAMLPWTMARVLGVDLAGAREMVARGIEGHGVAARVGKITVMIGDVELTVPCLFSSNEECPYLLGRMGLFSRYNITFDNRRKRIVLERIAS
jgi:predicted aspartyl protease